MSRKGEYVQKSLIYFGAVCTKDDQHFYTISDDKRIKDIDLMASIEKQRVDCPDKYQNIVISENEVPQIS